MANLLRPSKNLIKPLTTSLFAPTTRSAVTYKQALMNRSLVKTSSIDSTGIKVATESTDSPLATVGIWMNFGSRFESAENRGVSRMLERMAFKGTRTRSQKQIESELENVGAVIKSGTCRENMYFYTDCLSEDVPKVVEILADAFQNNTLSEESFQEEHKALVEELEAVQDNLKFITMEYLHTTAFQGTSMSQGMYGDTNTTNQLVRQDVVDYAHKFLRPSQMILAASGGVEHEFVKDLAQEHFKPAESLKLELISPTAARYIGSELGYRDDDKEMCHIAFAVEGPSWNDPDLIPMMVANSFIGSWNRTESHSQYSSSPIARDFFNKKYGHLFESFVIPYSDSGLWGIYMVADRMVLIEVAHCFQTEWMKLCTNMTEFRVERARNQLRSKILNQFNSSAGSCQNMATQLLFKGHCESLSDIDERISSVTPEILQEICYNRIYDKCPVYATVGPNEGFSCYYSMRRGMRWPVILL